MERIGLDEIDTPYAFSAWSCFRVHNGSALPDILVRYPVSFGVYRQILAGAIR